MHIKINNLDFGISVLKWIEEQIEIHKPDMVVNGGDTFDTHAVVRSEVQTEFSEHVIRCLKKGLNFGYWYDLGNHDQYKPKDNKYHALKAIKNFKPDGFTIIDKKTDFEDITFIPYINNDKDFPKETKSLVFAHQTFKGADFGDYRPDAIIDGDKIIGAKLVVSGDVHKRQTVGRVIYPGSVYSFNDKDLDQVKGILLIDSKTYETTFIESPFPLWKSLEIDLSDKTDSSTLIEDLKNAMDKKHHYTLKISGYKAEIVGLTSSKEFKNLKKEYDIKISPKYLDKAKKLTTIKTATMEETLKDYIDKIYTGTLNKEILYNKSLKILNKQ
jgi:DNA repair exonuclease SbcCD nuclease subunit